jgi:GWxTD domain-containing protein
MTLLELWLHTPLAQSIGFALLHFLWEGVLIAVALAAALCMARSARARYGAACIAMLLMLASFSVTLVRLRPRPIDLATAAKHPPKLAAAPVGLPLIPASARPEPSVLAAVLPWMAMFWAAGVLFFHLRSLGGWMAARRLRLSGVCRAPGEWQQRLDGLAARLRVSRPATLLESCLAEAPVVIGYLRPVILIPVSLLAGLPAEQMEAILIHELAHIRRRDYLVNLLQAFVEGLLFYHPAVWWISGVIRAERENCCDDLAVATIGDARAYAAALAALEQNRWTAHELALAASGGSLVKRIRRLLQQPERSRAAWTPAISAGILVAGAAVALASWQTPPTQKAQAPIASVAAPVAIATPPVATPAAPVKKSTLKLLAQAQPAAQTPQLAPAGQAPQLTTPYRKWLNEDVAYIIADQERQAFKSLTSDEEREQFITQFWQRRDPTPATAENEYKEEHYRRIAYANEHFATSSMPNLPGWKTDRGRIYITYGPPDEIEDHSAGGFYQRPPQEGNGATSTYPFQQWRYRFIDGVGNNVIIEFVDPTKTGEFRMTSDPAEKYPEKFAALQQAPRLQDNNYVPGQVRTQPANVFVSVGDGPKVTVSITADRKMSVNVALPTNNGAGKYDIVGAVADTQNRMVANVKDVAAGSTYNAVFTMHPGNYTFTVAVRDQASGAIQNSTVSYYVN